MGILKNEQGKLSSGLGRLFIVLAVFALMAAFINPILARANEPVSEEGAVESSESGSANYQLSFIYMDSLTINYGETQYFAFGLSDSSLQNPETARLTLSDPNGKEITLTADSYSNNTVLFKLEADYRCVEGSYSLLELSFMTDEGVESTEIDISAGAIGSPSFTIVATGSNSGARLLSDSADSEELETGYVTEDGSSSSLEEAIQESEGFSRARSLDHSGEFVVVIDPGHGGSDPGAVGNGLRESDLNLRISQYLASELSEYDGVRVLVTRDSDTYVGLTERSDYAASVGADLFISVHINSGGGRGAEVWVPNTSSWHSDFHQIGELLANQILSQLQSVGLDNRGAMWRDYPSPNYYPDGSQADYLAVIRGCRSHGIPAILVEHGFIDNSYDASLLAQDSVLQQLGRADANGIANYYQFRKGSRPHPYVSDMDNGSLTLQWESVEGATKYAIAVRLSDGSYKTYTYDCEDTQYTISGLTNGEVYEFLVQAYINGEWNKFSPELDNISCKLVPSPKVSVEQNGDGSLKLEWNAIDRCESYAIAEKTENGYRTFTLEEEETDYIINNLSNGIEHSFLVQAKVNGTWSSTSENYLASAIPEGETRPRVSAKAGNGEVALSWQQISGAERYAVAWRRSGTSAWTTSTYDCSGTSYTVRGLSNGTSYEFVVQAMLQGGWSATQGKWKDGGWSAFGSGDVASCTPADPYSPHATAQPTGDGEVTISWEAVPGAERYAVAERLSDGTYRTFTYDCTGTSWKAGDLANGREHVFLVQAWASGRWSAIGDELLCSATPTGTTRPAVTAEPANGSVELSWGAVPGAERYAVAWRRSGTSAWTTSTYDCSGTSYTVRGLSNGTSYEFVVQAMLPGGWSAFGSGDVVTAITLGTPIMGPSLASVDQLVDCFNSTGHEYPSGIYRSLGASTISDFCLIVEQEASAEGVRAEVVFAQAMKETGWLQFGGVVDATQCNFAGLGAVSNSICGASFANVRIGIRAQVQHLKAYASNQPLYSVCVDPRFNLVSRGSATTLEELNGRWAVPGIGYGESIASIINIIL